MAARANKMRIVLVRAGVRAWCVKRESRQVARVWSALINAWKPMNHAWLMITPGVIFHAQSSISLASIVEVIQTVRLPLSIVMERRSARRDALITRRVGAAICVNKATTNVRPYPLFRNA